MKSKATKSLKIVRTISLLLIVNTSLQVFLSVNGHYPIWLLVLQLLPLPIFLFLIIVICLDLIKQDCLTIRGKLLEKKESGRKAYFIKVLIHNGKARKFRFNKVFSDEYNVLQIDQRVEVSFFKRTKAVTAISHFDS